ncbi:MAG: DUF1294 domain-containing protein [Planctomycetota bacterium]|nr:DUF1294 domain-containing protein [Planctomycetota bacterium]
MQWILIAYAAMSVVTILAYGLDKRKAKKNAWRTPEKTLHLLELLGGFPGALLGQVLFRHKTKKWSFLIVTWAIIALHGAAWAWWFLRE